MKSTLFVMGLGMLVLAGAGCQRTPEPQGVACTMEAMQCPDGSYVGRQGPNCAFAPCPVATSTPPVVSTSTAALPFSKDDLIQVDASFGQMVFESGVMVTGTARGPWYFEASFPVELRDANNSLMASTVAQAQTDWMTTNYVPFSFTLNFGMPTTATGTLILKKDNPSGEPANDNQLVIPVQF